MDVYQRRRLMVLLVLAGLFLGSLGLLNVLGISRFIDLSFRIGPLRVPMMVAVGVLAYPITFLSTDFISELYGRRVANQIVWVGLMVNLWVLFVLWLGGVLPPTAHLDAAGMPPLPSAEGWQRSDWAFFRVRQLTFGAVAASMAAYLSAQFVDVHVFHFLKRLTHGRHLWIRNNFSTLTAQWVDSAAVILITHYVAHALPIDPGQAVGPQLWVFIVSSYLFKMLAALVDTLPFYVGTHYLRRYLNITDAKH